MPACRGDEVPEDSFETFYEPARRVCIAVLRRKYMSERTSALSSTRADEVMTIAVDDALSAMSMDWNSHDPTKATRLTFLMVMARRRFSKALRRLNRNLSRCVAMPDSVAAPRSEVNELIEREAAQQALSKLPPPQAQALHLRFVQDKSVKDIAHDMDRTVASVQSLLQRGKESLRLQLGGFDDRSAI